jgi:hypothetical protein
VVAIRRGALATASSALCGCARLTKGIVWTAEQSSWDDWPRAWRHLEPLFGDCDPNTVTPEIMLQVRTDIVQAVSESEAHRTIKVWRARLKKMAAFGYCQIDRDPPSSSPTPPHCRDRLYGMRAKSFA